MKKSKILLIFFCTIILILFGNKVYASNEIESKKILYQDITVNKDGSMKVKEAMWLNGEYNGANRKIKIKNKNACPFIGIYSNFSGDSDIYNASKLSNIKVYDIHQYNFKSIEDINKIENKFKKVDKANKGQYGVYTVKETEEDSIVTIYCPSKKNKVIYLEYIIEDAIVVHNDVAELYWCFLENISQETILDYQAVVHLPEEDKNVMLWSHGPASGKCSIVNNKTLLLKDEKVRPYEYETLRIMFDKKLVSKAKKFSNINGKEKIIKYEKTMANPNIADEESKKIEIENNLIKTYIDLEKKQDMFLYNKANELLEEITWNDILKQEYKEKINSMREKVDEKWKKSIATTYNLMIESKDISKFEIEFFKEKVDEGFNEQVKNEYYRKINDLEAEINYKKIKTKHNILRVVIILYSFMGIILVGLILKMIKEKKKYKSKYYRDFPSNDNAYIIDYLINKKVTANTFIVTILDLIAKKRIALEKNFDDEEDFNFVLLEKSPRNTITENTVVEILFEIIGKENKCSIKKLKNYGTKKENSKKLINCFTRFKQDVESEIKYKKYFKKNNKINSILNTILIFIGVISFALGFYLVDNGYIHILKYYIITNVLNIIYYKIISKYKGRTEKGELEYSKWLAHKRFLIDFGKFDTKELPEIILWEKYFVTAVTLGCSEKILNRLEMHFVNYNEIEKLESMIFEYKIINETKGTLNKLCHSAKLYSKNKINSSSSKSSYSSGKGYGGGSSSGGSGGGGGGWSRF